MLELGDRIVDLDAGRIDGGERLTPTETAMLRRLTAERGRTVSTAALLADVWGYAPTVTTRTVATAMARLRRKVEPDPTRPRWLLTAHGEGYLLAAAPTVAPTPTPLIGRAATLAAVQRWLRDVPRGRWLTLTGPAGCGKSSVLAALGHTSGFPGGVHTAAGAEAGMAWLGARQGLGRLLLLDLGGDPPDAVADAGVQVDPRRVRVVCAARRAVDLAGAAAVRVGPLAPHAEAALAEAHGTASTGTGWPLALVDPSACRAAAAATLAGLPAGDLAALREGWALAPEAAERLYDAGLVDLDAERVRPCRWTPAILAAGEGRVDRDR